MLIFLLLLNSILSSHFNDLHKEKIEIALHLPVSNLFLVTLASGEKYASHPKDSLDSLFMFMGGMYVIQKYGIVKEPYEFKVLIDLTSEILKIATDDSVIESGFAPQAKSLIKDYLDILERYFPANKKIEKPNTWTHMYGMPAVLFAVASIEYEWKLSSLEFHLILNALEDAQNEDFFICDACKEFLNGIIFAVRNAFHVRYVNIKTDS
jgi:hypothetical protein